MNYSRFQQSMWYRCTSDCWLSVRGIINGTDRESLSHTRNDPQMVKLTNLKVPTVAVAFCVHLIADGMHVRVLMEARRSWISIYTPID